MADVFTWLPDDKPDADIQHRNRAVQFGDGYKQIAKDGLNANSQVWNLTFDRDEATVTAIAAFIDAHQAVYFLWTPPADTVQRKVICEGYSKQPYLYQNERLTCKFEEFFVP